MGTPSAGVARVCQEPLGRRAPAQQVGLVQKRTSKSIGRQGIALKQSSSLQKGLCPVVICPCSCSSDWYSPPNVVAVAAFLRIRGGSETQGDSALPKHCS